jgi:hypothetical protein
MQTEEKKKTSLPIHPHKISPPISSPTYSHPMHWFRKRVIREQGEDVVEQNKRLSEPKETERKEKLEGNEEKS